VNEEKKLKIVTRKKGGRSYKSTSEKYKFEYIKFSYIKLRTNSIIYNLNILYSL